MILHIVTETSPHFCSQSGSRKPCGSSFSNCDTFFTVSEAASGTVPSAQLAFLLHCLPCRLLASIAYLEARLRFENFVSPGEEN